MYRTLLAIHAHHDIVRLHISMDQTPPMHVLEALDDLGKDDHVGFQGELAPAIIEKVFQRWTQQLCYHVNIVLFDNDSLMFKLRKTMTTQEP